MNYLERMVVEFNELYEKATKLSDFIESQNFLKISRDHKILMVEQLQIQMKYLQILEKRIKLS